MREGLAVDRGTPNSSLVESSGSSSFVQTLDPNASVSFRHLLRQSKDAPLLPGWPTNRKHRCKFHTPDEFAQVYGASQGDLDTG
jgi:hypothetical protein